MYVRKGVNKIVVLKKIQNKIIKRLEQGLGSMVFEISPYPGPIDNKEAIVGLKKAPAILLTFNQALVKVKDSGRQRYELIAGFYIVCVCNRVKDTTSQLSVDINDLVYSVLRLLAGQRLNEELNSLGLQPKTIRPVFISPLDSKIKNLDIVAIEFEAVCDIYGIDSDGYPKYTTDKNNPDYLFSLFKGQTSEPPSQFNSLILNIKNKNIPS